MDIAKDAALIMLPLVIAIGQVLFKLTSRDVGAANMASLMKLSVNGYFILALVLYGTATVAWVYVLRHFPLNKAYLFMGLTFVFVPLLSYLFLKEPVNIRYLAGAAFIIFGIWLAKAA
ncbi:EamA family transporter [Sneathiella sp.]|uniref:EamA family transporter n=1 Tax=Sneathiella sp. TaxID=1964365 RepID=UPI00262E3692|nr:EamA family transporter [Sneathiella sp.]MDF2368634.1 EamA family transporter [Sneathiella sp.]